MCVCSEEYIFLGSRLGNSLLVRFTEKDENTVITIDDSDILGKEKEKGLTCVPNLVLDSMKIYAFDVLFSCYFCNIQRQTSDWKKSSRCTVAV